MCCNFLESPIGIGCEDVYLQWSVEGKAWNVNQFGYHIQIADDILFEKEAIIYDINRKTDKQSEHVKITLRRS